MCDRAPYETFCEAYKTEHSAEQLLTSYREAFPSISGIWKTISETDARGLGISKGYSILETLVKKSQDDAKA